MKLDSRTAIHCTLPQNPGLGSTGNQIRGPVEPGFAVLGNIEHTHKAGKDPEAQRSSVDVYGRNSACEIVATH